MSSSLCPLCLCGVLMKTILYLFVLLQLLRSVSAARASEMAQEQALSVREQQYRAIFIGLALVQAVLIGSAFNVGRVRRTAVLPTPARA